MKRKGILIVLSVILVLGLVASCTPTPTTTPTTPAGTGTPTATPTTPPPTQQQVYTWQFQTIVSAAHLAYGIDKELAERTKQVTNGRLIIQTHTVGEIAPVSEMVKAVGSGALDIAFTCSTYHMGLIPEANVEGGLPFSYYGNYSYNEAFLYYGLSDLLKKAYAQQNVYYLSWGNPGSSLILTKKPLSKPEDLKGMKLRTTGLSANLVEALGGTSSFIATAELYQALQLGTIDGTITVPGTMDGMKLQETAKYLKGPGVYEPAGQCIIVNMDSYNKLPQDLKYALEWIWGPEARERYAIAEDFHSEEIIAKMIRDGVTYSTWTQDQISQMRTIARGVWRKDAAKDPRTEAAYKMVDDYLVKKGKLPALPAGEKYAIK